VGGVSYDLPTEDYTYETCYCVQQFVDCEIDSGCTDQKAVAIYTCELAQTFTTCSIDCNIITTSTPVSPMAYYPPVTLTQREIEGIAVNASRNVYNTATFTTGTTFEQYGAFFTVDNVQSSTFANQYAFGLYAGWASSKNARIGMVVFRGTDNPGNLVRDINAVPTICSSLSPDLYCTGSVHPGFAGGYSTFSTMNRKMMQQYYNQSYNLICAGHSLGAAMAVLAANDLYQYSGIRCTPITIGCPRVGDDYFEAYFDNFQSQSTSYISTRFQNFAPVASTFRAHFDSGDVFTLQSSPYVADMVTTVPGRYLGYIGDHLGNIDWETFTVGYSPPAGYHHVATRVALCCAQSVVDSSWTGWGAQLAIHSSNIYESNVQYLEETECNIVGNDARRRDIQDTSPAVTLSSDNANVALAFDSFLVVQYSTTSTNAVMSAITNVSESMTINNITTNLTISLPASLNLTAGCSLNISIGLVPAIPSVSNAIVTYPYNVSSPTPGIVLASPVVGDFWVLFESSCPQNFTMSSSIKAHVSASPTPVPAPISHSSATRLWYSYEVFVLFIFVAFLMM